MHSRPETSIQNSMKAKRYVAYVDAILITLENFCEASTTNKCKQNESMGTPRFTTGIRYQDTCQC
jgi:hypothetical protein